MFVVCRELLTLGVCSWLQEAQHQAWGLEEGQTGHSRLKGAWMRLGQKSCDGERLKRSTVVDVLLLFGHLWLLGRGLAAGSSTRHRSDDQEATTAESCPHRDVTAP